MSILIRSPMNQKDVRKQQGGVQLYLLTSCTEKTWKTIGRGAKIPADIPYKATPCTENICRDLSLSYVAKGGSSHTRLYLGAMIDSTVWGYSSPYVIKSSGAPLVFLFCTYYHSLLFTLPFKIYDCAGGETEGKIKCTSRSLTLKAWIKHTVMYAITSNWEIFSAVQFSFVVKRRLPKCPRREDGVVRILLSSPRPSKRAQVCLTGLTVSPDGCIIRSSVWSLGPIVSTSTMVDCEELGAALRCSFASRFSNHFSTSCASVNTGGRSVMGVPLGFTMCLRTWRLCFDVRQPELMTTTSPDWSDEFGSWTR